MKNFLLRMLLAAAVTLLAFAFSSPAQAQQADEDRASSAAPRQAQSPDSPQSPQQHDASAVPPGDSQTQEVLAFTGRVMKEQGQFVLKDPVTKMSYQLDAQARAKPYAGKHVKITGKLEMNSNTIHIAGIEPLS